MPEAIEIVFKRRRLDYFVNPERVPIASGDYVVVEADRGLDLGQVRHLAVSVPRPERTGRFRTIVRRADTDDIEQLAELRKEEEEAKALCKERIRHFGLDMKLVDVEGQLDGNLITFYFTAESRVDFRDLVKELAAEFRTRIELRQIGARDAAKRLGGIGPCGREYCCSTWLKEFQPVTLKMAKNQGLALAPSKISGGCGRLMCCLMYEDPTYRELSKLFPKQGSKFEVEGKLLVVVANDFFRETVRLRDEEGNSVEWSIEEFPVPREEWRGAVRQKGAPGRGGSGSGCSKPDPKPTGMTNARALRRESGGEGARPFGGAPLLQGGRGRRADAPKSAPTPQDLVRLRAAERRREDGAVRGSGREMDPPNAEGDEGPPLEGDLIAWSDPPKEAPPSGGAGAERGRFRRRRRRGSRSGGGGRGSNDGTRRSDGPKPAL